MKIITFYISILLSTLILINSFKVSIVYAYYNIDTAGFIEKLCENKDKPEMQCNGKCHLKKVAESNSSNDNKAPEKIINFKEIQLYIVSETSLNFISSRIKKELLSSYSNLYTYSTSSILDHPPQV